MRIAKDEIIFFSSSLHLLMCSLANIPATRNNNKNNKYKQKQPLYVFFFGIT